MSKRVTGIGGVFIKTNDTNKMKEWYSKHLGLNCDQYGAVFGWRSYDHPERTASTIWSPFKNDTPYFEPSKKEFMINYRVEDLINLLSLLKEEGIEQIGSMESFEYGKFAWIMDPDGNKIELWEPVDQVFDEMYKDGKYTK